MQVAIPSKIKQYNHKSFQVIFYANDNNKQQSTALQNFIFIA